MTTNSNTILSWFKTERNQHKRNFGLSGRVLAQERNNIPQDSVNSLVNTLNTKANKA
jgi:hypothetical protein